MSFLADIRWLFILKHTYFRVCKGGIARIGRNVSIRNSRIIITPGSTIEIGDNVIIENTTISVDNGHCTIGDSSYMGNPKESFMLNIEEGSVNISHHTKICAERFWIRFGGVLKVGCYTNINGGSEIRCDDSISIGDFNQISFKTNIWDTNTHNILSVEERRKAAVIFFPYFGKEISRPSTAPITIGDDCWIGQGTTILKGSSLGDEVVVGYGSVIAGKKIPDKSTVVTDINLKIIKR